MKTINGQHKENIPSSLEVIYCMWESIYIFLLGDNQDNG